MASIGLRDIRCPNDFKIFYKSGGAMPVASATPPVTPSISISATPSISITPSVSISKTPSISVTPSISETPSISVTPSISETPSVSITPSISETPTASPITTPSISITPSTSIEPEPSLTPSPSDPHLVYFSYSIYGSGGNLTVLDKDDNELLDVNTPDSGSLSISESVLPYSVVGSCRSGSGNKVRFHACNKNGGGEVFTSEDNWPGGITVGEHDTYLCDPTPPSVFVELRANDVALNDCPIPLET